MVIHCFPKMVLYGTCVLRLVKAVIDGKTSILGNINIVNGEKKGNQLCYDGAIAVFL